MRCATLKPAIWTGICPICVGLDRVDSSVISETNLKIKQGRTETAHILSSTEAAKLSGKIKSELPNNSLYTFEGTMLMDGGKEFPLDPSQILLRVPLHLLIKG